MEPPANASVHRVQTAPAGLGPSSSPPPMSSPEILEGGCSIRREPGSSPSAANAGNIVREERRGIRERTVAIPEDPPVETVDGDWVRAPTAHQL